MAGSTLQKLPTLTVVTVCLNSDRTIHDTIASVLAQKDAQIEYLVIDGESTDRTLEILASQGSHLDDVVSEPDHGIADAFNKGICRAKGDLVGLINADDMLLPGALDRVRSWFASHPEFDVLHGDVLLYDGDHFIKRLTPAGCWWYPWRLVLFNHPATFVRGSVYREQGLFDTSYAVAMDVEIFLRWMRKGVRIAYLPESLVRMRAGGVSGSQPFRGYREVRRALLQHRFNAPLAYLQYLARMVLQQVVVLQNKLRALRYGR